jgi:signal transduction histidine kinase
MISTSSANLASPEVSESFQSETIENIQELFGQSLGATVLITSSNDKYLSKPYFNYPFINPDTGISKLWNCCESTILQLNENQQLNKQAPTSRICACSQTISLTKLSLLNQQEINLITIQLTSNNCSEEKFIQSAVKSGYSKEDAIKCFQLTRTVDEAKFNYISTLLFHQTELLYAVLNQSLVADIQKREFERNINEQALIKAKNEAEESSRLKSSLLANMSHELRTPMTGILGFSEILHDELEDNRLKSMASTIFKSANRLMTTLNSIMDLSAIESNRTNLTLKVVNVKNTFMGLLRNAYNIASDKGLYIRTALPPNVNVIADEKLLEQILHHLLDNAIKFTIDGGISISAYAGLRDTSDVVIKISDTGIGIAPQHHKLIFEEFRQVSEGLSRTFEGSGLGLSLVMKIAKLLNARVWVESIPEKGSDFFIALPSAAVVNEEIAPVIEKIVPINTVRLGRGNVPEVLIVEDNEINRRLAALYLREICNIDMAENGYTAMIKIKEKKYDAILMDINLGAGPNGIHVANEIRAIEHYKDVPIIAVTGYTMQGDREKLLANGCTHYVAKPYDKRTLIKLFSGLLYQPNAN